MSHKQRNTELAKQIRNFRASTSVTDDAIFDFFSSLNTPKSLAAWLLYSNGETQQLVDLSVVPEHYSCALKYRDDYAVVNFLAKANFLDLPVSKKEAALTKFAQYEQLCGQTNRRFTNPSLDPLFCGSNVWLLNALRRKIDVILGDFGGEELVDQANWGPGVTTLLKGSHVSAVNKFQSESGITRDLYSLVKPWFAEAYPLWADHLESEVGPELFTPQMGNEIVTVPKNSKTDRVIAIEPGINLWFQKAVGSMIRRRLRRVGINLNSQETNQRLARESSKDGKLATVDFSSASDSISRELIREVMPPRWFLLMDSMRSKIGFLDEQLVTWNKFSSMGNGFTFELESLIFFAAASVTTEYLGVDGEISVFGDDVILPTLAYQAFSSFSEFLGFKVNSQKSFSSGYFRESCGSHFYDGVDCKPLYLKERVQNAQAIYKLANGLRRLAHRRNSYCGCDARLRESVRRLQLRLPKSFRFCIPEGVGDGGFISNFDEATPALAERGFEGYLVSVLLEVGCKSDHFESTGMLLARLKVRSTEEYGNTYTLRGQTRLRVSRILVPRWYNLGCWCVTPQLLPSS